MITRLQVAGQWLQVPYGTPLHLALLRNGCHVETPCGARGSCRKCRVKLSGAVPPPAPADREHLAPAELALGYRLACQHRAAGVLAVAVLPEAPVDPRKAALSRLDGTVTPEPWADLGLAPGGSRPCGLALDLGTTTLVGALLDLATGEELAAAVLPNPQGAYGADLISRLTFATAAPEHPRELQVLVVRAVNDLIDRLCRRARVEPAAVVAATVVGNPCMQHLFLGLDVRGLAVAPYVPAVTAPLERRAAELGLHLPDAATVCALPAVAGFVGADALAAALAVGLDEGDGTVALVDIGTNGECLLRHAGTVYACSAPAGPAFEGGELEMGMRAGPGAVEAVYYDPDADPPYGVSVLPGAPARGICGSGLLDAAAVLCATGALDVYGTLSASGPLADRVLAGDGGFVVAGTAGGTGEQPVLLTQRDIRQLQLAKGAIRAGIEVLLRAAGVAAANLDGLLLAGAFGNYLRRESALAIGLLPPLPPARVRPVGNAAAQGARLVLISRRYRERVEALARRVRFVDLATHPDFEAVFLSALNFPVVEATTR